MRILGVRLRRLGATAAIIASTAAAGCTSTCDNAGVTVDGQGNVVVRGEGGFVSPNSSILRNVSQWPQPPPEEENFSFSQGYALTRDGAMYVLENTAQHPNLVYRIDLSTGQSAPIASQGSGEAHVAALTSSNETSIAANGRFAYSVDQKVPAIRRAAVLLAHPALTTFIAGPKTRLNGPIGVAADDAGRVCALDSGRVVVLCYPPNEGGDVPPATTLDLKKLLGYALGWSLVLDRSGNVVVSGTTDPNGVTGFSIAVIDIAAAVPRVVRLIAGPNTRIVAPELAVDDGGDILALQTESPTAFGVRELLVFGPDQRGDATPRFVRQPAAGVTNPFRLAIDRQSGDAAILGSDGVALFRGAARRPPWDWPAAIRLPYRGWSIAFGGRSRLVVANQFGAIDSYAIERAVQTSGSGRGAPLNLHDPEFVATDAKGNVYVASTAGVITAVPSRSAAMGPWSTRNFATVFGRSMDAFAPDSKGYFYLSSGRNNAIIALAPGGRQSTIGGSKTDLNDPLGLAVNGEGALFVANAGGRDVLVFARGSAGNTAPVARIAGYATQLVEPQALAIDAKGRLYVFDGPQTASFAGGRHYVRVYGRNARGNVGPIETYEVKTKCWTNAP